ncbi:hypothetical protein VOLCADRAFT_96299 [Volvox carteri f. nagariensis]|uniref:Uncharacterized protein n=1 Tax=Volvox carteri f. nagariensis TaxID=3068 RepID=D8U9R4_VOLCA|nr:uncharacterized protein VOLCADRAFT_96299 [Volvox carteri f. nagariensis]EFJ43455.1 hypothetical protein VOLCADRAFT_96299 [Volvox carteri f. nagariensis]|eukprot:XP_002955384.1 hypothetical protein VOLCADRAFT_96299 [Volvox carteri f. nagariensis]
MYMLLRLLHLRHLSTTQTAPQQLSIAAVQGAIRQQQQLQQYLLGPDVKFAEIAHSQGITAAPGATAQADLERWQEREHVTLLGNVTKVLKAKAHAFPSCAPSMYSVSSPGKRGMAAPPVAEPKSSRANAPTAVQPPPLLHDSTAPTGPMHGTDEVSFLTTHATTPH